MKRFNDLEAFRLSADDKRALRAAAQAAEKSRGELIREGLALVLERYRVSEQ